MRSPATLVFLFGSVISFSAQAQTITFTGDCGNFQDGATVPFYCTGDITIDATTVTAAADFGLSGTLTILNGGSFEFTGNPTITIGTDLVIDKGATIVLTSDIAVDVAGDINVGLTDIAVASTIHLLPTTTPTLFTATNFNLKGVINSDGRGGGPGAAPGAGCVIPNTSGKQSGGGGNGGLGGRSTVGACGQRQASASSPSALGKGAADCPTFLGGHGGGGVKILITDTLTINGTITANGTNGKGGRISRYNYQYSGGGSGGSVWLEAHTLAGAGNVSVRGGLGGPSLGGNGGGGRIAYYYVIDNSTISYDATTPTTGSLGGNGTIWPMQLLANGSQCVDPNRCVSGLCADGVCCDGTCGGPCEGCNVAGIEGTCSPIPAGQNPADECGATVECGVACDGNRGCGMTPPGTGCGGVDCQACDGTGSCGADADGAACGPYANAISQCGSGNCVLNCEPGFGDCDGNPANGCEVDLFTSTAHCGVCDALCPSVPNAARACVAGSCQPTCNTNWADCDGNAGNGCEASLLTTANCSACGVTCVLNNAVGTCASGSCVIAVCSGSFVDCDGAAANGCEALPGSDVNSCTGCGVPCGTRPNATANCVASTCLFPCDAGFEDCNGTAGDGCEVETASDLANCGGCGTGCAPANATGSCSGGSCGILSCAAGFADCNGNPADGCEVPIDTLTDCGACGVACSLANGSSDCATGSCLIAACDAGFDDCDGNAATGCEVSLMTTTDCSVCGQLCAPANSTGSCGTGACLVATCDAGFENCNASAADGCEIDTDNDVDNCGTCGNVCQGGGTIVGCVGGQCVAGSPPGSVLLLEPAEAQTRIGANATLKWSQPTGTPSISYTVEVAEADPTFTSVAWSESGLAVTTAQVAGLLPGRIYYWRVVAENAFGQSVVDPPGSFSTGSAPVAVLLQSPTNGEELLPLDASLLWLDQPDTAQPITYTVAVDALAVDVVDLMSIAVWEALGGQVGRGVTYSWTVSARNDFGTGPASPLWSFTTSRSYIASDLVALLQIAHDATDPEVVDMSGRASLHRVNAPIADYRFVFGDGSAPQSGLAFMARHTYLAPGGYTARLTVTDTQGQSSLDAVAVQISSATNQVPPAVIGSASPDFGELRNGALEVQFSATIIPGSSPVIDVWWEFGDGARSFEVAPTHSYEAPRDYQAKVSVLDPNGLTAVDFVQVNVTATDEPSPLMVLGWTDSPAGIAPHELTLNCTAIDPEATPGVDPGLTFSWDPGDEAALISGAVSTHTYLEPGVFDATCTVVAQDGRAGSYRVEVRVTTPTMEIPPRIVSVGATEVCAGQPYRYNDATRASARGIPSPIWTVGKRIRSTQKGAPNDFAIDPSTGMVTWQPSLEQVGLQEVVLIASNGAGQDAQEYEVNVEDCSGVVEEPQPVTRDRFGCSSSHNSSSAVLLLCAALLLWRPRVRRRRT